MEEERKPRVAITHGDTNGVGYEQILKTFEDPMIMELCTPIVYGSPKVATYHRKAMDLQTQFSIIASAEEAKDNRLNLLTTFDEEIKIDFGQPSEDASQAARKALKQAMVDVQKGLADVLVMAPDNLPDFLSKEPEVLWMHIADEMRVALVTSQLALKDVPKAIDKQIIVNKARIMYTCLRRDLRISNPRIAVLALNPPTANEADRWGEEEKNIIIPAVEELAEAGIQAFGPYAADAFFGNGDYTKFDAVLAMYYEQGMAPLKTLAAEGSIALATGMPFVCVKPETGVLYNIAGQGKADETALRHALFMGIDVFRNRVNYDEPMAHPLPKLYKEKRDESERVRFNVPKAKDSKKEETEKKQ
ncbi:MAG: 4-hydroxythreonine-4-phosphate dehydrogenase PdxA [Prevotella sp.]|jgi:4-hydroxythreonine-4-phosphate dehydrogenase|nr:4-hydroxythreonine-4-phosphate dehydrogenase PdxA [Prevotella sp.]